MSAPGSTGAAAQAPGNAEAAVRVPSCRCCGSGRVELRGRKVGEFLRREFEFYACLDCGFLMVEPFSGFEIYNDAYYRGAGPDPYVDYEAEYHDWKRSERMLEFDDLARVAAKQVAPGATPLRWLDFGCGAGGFLKYLRERGTLSEHPIELTGHDVGSYAELLKSRDGFRILDWDALGREPDESYDVISMIEVIEHLPDPREPMRLVSRLLRPGGLLLLTTGNLASPVARREGIHYRYCAPEIHVSLFNPRCLAHLYRQTGLEPLAVRYRGAVKFKVLKSLRHRRALRAFAAAGLALPPVVRAVDGLYGVSAMPCAIKPRRKPNAEIPNLKRPNAK